MSLLDCQHPASGEARHVCHHLLPVRETSFVQHFTGKGLEFQLVCPQCARSTESLDNLPRVCSQCFQEILQEGDKEGIIGEPEIHQQPSTLYFQHSFVRIPRTEAIRDMRPIGANDQNLWLAVTEDGQLVRIDLDQATLEPCLTLPAAEHGPDLSAPVSLHLCRQGRLAAVVNTRGQRGLVVDLETSRVTMTLDRGNYHNQHCRFPLAFWERQGRTLLLHGTQWSRLDVSDPRTGQLLTAREYEPAEGGSRPPHYLDYFHCGLCVSPTEEYVADNGWVWHPVGVVRVWSLSRWLGENVWESEDGPSVRPVCYRYYYWDGPLCWIGLDRLAVWGQGEDDEWLIPAARIFRMPTGEEERWFAGPRGDFVFDDYLFSFDAEAGMSVWDVDSGARLLREEGFSPWRYHPGTKCFLTLQEQGTIRLSRLCGVPMDRGWLTGNDGAVARLARAIADEAAFDRLPILADALEEAGCEDSIILGHCRRPGPHGNSCWVIHWLLTAP